MWTKKFWQAATERIVRGAACGVSAGWFGGDVVFDMWNVQSWQDIAGLAVTGALTSLLMSLGGGAFGTGSGPSFTGTERLNPNPNR